MSTPHHHTHIHETAPLHDAPDDWHDHARDEKPQHAHAEVGNAPLITGVGVGLFLVIVFACVAVYAYYTWYITARLSYTEVAFSETSPAIQARKYKQDAYLRLKSGGPVAIPAEGEAPAINYTLGQMDQVIAAAAAKPAVPPAEPPVAPMPATPRQPAAKPQ